jgi:hypothetical protein
MKILNQLFVLSALCILVSCSSSNKLTTANQIADINKIKFLGQYVVPYNLKFQNTTIGGLSGIDYNAKEKKYYMISDDRSAINPARYYTAQISFTQKGIDTVAFTGVHFMLQHNGNVYPNNKQDPYHTPDPEALRYDMATKQLIWSSEGERIIKEKDTVLENPAVTIISPNGKYIDSFILPHNLIMQSSQNGPRRNSVLEGLSFADNYKSLFVSVEEPLLEDGPRSDVNQSSITRFFKFDMATRKNISQYAYTIDPVARPAIPENSFKINGIPDILCLGNDKILVIERSFSTGSIASTIKVFLANFKNATDVKNNPSFTKDKNFTPATKKLLLNMDDLGIYIDNIEGVTFGPVLPNGHKTLLFIADNNFNPIEKTQFLLFEITE